MKIFKRGDKVWRVQTSDFAHIFAKLHTKIIQKITISILSCNSFFENKQELSIRKNQTKL